MSFRIPSSRDLRVWRLLVGRHFARPSLTMNRLQAFMTGLRLYKYPAPVRIQVVRSGYARSR